MNYQQSGATKTLSQANDAISAAVRDTPVAERSLYRSWIRYEIGNGRYLWYWILK